MRVYPAAGLRVHDPRTRALIPLDGIEVEETDLAFHRLLMTGDVTTEPAAVAQAAVPEADPPFVAEHDEPASAGSPEAGETL